MAKYDITTNTDSTEDAALAVELAARGITAEELFQETLRNLLSGLVAVHRQAEVLKIVEALKVASDSEVAQVKTVLSVAP